MTVARQTKAQPSSNAARAWRRAYLERNTFGRSRRFIYLRAHMRLLHWLTSAGGPAIGAKTTRYRRRSIRYHGRARHTSAIPFVFRACLCERTTDVIAPANCLDLRHAL